MSSVDRDMRMSIWGEFKTPEAVEELAEAFNHWVAPDWQKSRFDHETATRHILESLDDGQEVVVVRENTARSLNDISHVCRRHELSYEIFSIYDNENTSHMLTVWAPGFDNEKHFDADEKARPLFAIDGLSRKIKNDPSNAVAIIEEFEKQALVGVERVATASDEVIEAVKRGAVPTPGV